MASKDKQLPVVNMASLALQFMSTRLSQGRIESSMQQFEEQRSSPAEGWSNKR